MLACPLRGTVELGSGALGTSAPRGFLKSKVFGAEIERISTMGQRAVTYRRLIVWRYVRAFPCNGCHAVFFVPNGRFASHMTVAWPVPLPDPSVFSRPVPETLGRAARCAVAALQEPLFQQLPLSP